MVELFVKNTQHYIWCLKRHCSKIMYGGRSIIIWGCFAASGQLVRVEMNSWVYQGVLQDNIRLAVEADWYSRILNIKGNPGQSDFKERVFRWFVPVSWHIWHSTWSFTIRVSSRIRSHFMTIYCRKPDNSKGFTYFSLPLYYSMTKSIVIYMQTKPTV